MKISHLFRVIIIVFYLLAWQFTAVAQKGYPFVSPFSFGEAIDNDNFDLLQDNNQNILIANRKGILTFDSRKWDLLPLPYYPVVLKKSTPEGIIYIGCRNGFGSLELDATGKYSYKLLSDTIFTGEISNIQITDDMNYFLARNRIYFSSDENENLRYWEFPYEYYVNGGFTFKNEFYFTIYNKGLYKAEADTFKQIPDNLISSLSRLVFSFETENKDLLVGNDENKLFLFNVSGFIPVFLQDSEYLNAGIITDGANLGNSKIAIGTVMGGVLICDYKTGATYSILNSKTGLPDDEIYCLGTDNNLGLWLCHSFGVSRVDNSINVANLTWYEGLKGNLTNSEYFNDQLYVGTSEGLYILQEKRQYSEKVVYEKSKAVLIKRAEAAAPVGQPEIAAKDPQNVASEPVVVLSKKDQRKKRREDKNVADAEIKVQTTNQKSLIDKIFNTNSNPTRIQERLPDSPEVQMIRKKIYSLQSISHSFEKVPGVEGKCTEIMAFSNHLLVSSYYGLYDIRNNQTIEILPDTPISFLNKGIGDTIIFAGNEKSLFILLLRGNHWEVVREFDALNYPVYSACMTSPTELWLGSDNSVHKIALDQFYFTDSDSVIPVTTKFSDKVIIRSISNQLYFFLSSGIFILENNEIKPVKSFDKLSSLPKYFFSGDNMVWYRSEGNWDVLYDISKKRELPEEFLNIFQSVQDVSLNGEDELFIIANNSEVYRISNAIPQNSSDEFSIFFSGLKGTDDKPFPLIKPRISYKKSSLRIEFSAPYYLAPAKTEFSYQIKGLNDEWSPWSTISTVEYPLLPPGEYEIQAKARNIFGKESQMSTLEIVIRPPFYRTFVFYLLMAILIISLFVLVIRMREKALRKTKEILEQKVIERTAEIEKQKNEISEQKKEITDSILYASRIQTAVLPSLNILNTLLSEHFVLFLPKDIVSGDFYWLSAKEDKIIILAADCTGHGVPGAFMSMLGISFMNEIVSNHKLDNAGSILDELRNHVKSTLAKSGDINQTKDGMDIALCIVDLKQMKLNFAGAYNPLYMIRNNELTEFKGDKMPIGLYDLNTGFKNHQVSLNKGDCFYIFSDGFIDQFGGEFEKKFLSKPFKLLLQKIYLQPMNKQKELLHSTFKNWKGKLQQVDDVLIMGFRI